MFQFPALASCYARCHSFRMTGCPIRKSSDQRLFAPSLSRPSSPPRAKASAMRPCLLSFKLTFKYQVSSIRYYPGILNIAVLKTYGSIYTFSSLLNFTFCTSCQRSFLCFQRWWRITDSNRWPSACKADALASWANPPRVIEHRNNVLATTIFVRSSPRQSWTADLYIISVAL